MEKYNHKKIEAKWRKKWEKDKLYRTGEDKVKPKFYILDMFPYPSGAGLHVGHPKGYIATDIFARAKMMQGYNVLHPMGWDAFGLPAENYAIQNKIHPRVATEENIETFKSQLEKLGFTYDWDREINTTDPEFYKWTQWAFIKMFERGLAYESNEPVNWCPSCKTVLSNEDLENGKCERCGSQVERKPMRQWVLKITAYAERMLKDLEKLPDWEESIKEMQKNWIGRSEGAEVKFLIQKYPKIVLATSNNSKRERIKKLLKSVGISTEVLSPQELRIEEVKTKEDGSLSENSNEKVLAYKAKTDLPILALDSGFFIQGKEIDPVKVKRNALNGQSEEDLSQKEIAQKMVAYYQNIALEQGGMVEAYWSDHWTLLQPNGKILSGVSKREVILTGEIYGKVDEYFPLRSLYKVKSTGKYTAEQTEEDELIELDPITEVLKNLLTYDLNVFTTRPDTLFGATFFVMAPEHPLIKKITAAKQKSEVEKYIKAAAGKSDMERTELAKEKTGVFTGAYAVNPVNQEKIPVYIADYVMMGYGTGAIMAVPAHDERDWEFAIDHNLKILCVIKPQTIKDISFRFRQTDVGAFESSENVNAKHLIKGTRQLTGSVIGGFMLGEDESDEHFQERCFKKYQEDVERGKKCHTGDGVMINSDFLNDLDKEGAIKKMTAWLEEKKLGKRAVNYKIKDWVFSRQRYWGEPIPIVHCPKCGNVAVPYEELPLKLPEVKNYEPTGTGESPLANIKDWVNTKCPKCGGPGKRETNTMPQWAGSSWYYLRYIDPKNDEALVDKAKEKYWSPVDFYVGGAEHATRHLIYARFWHKFLFDIGAVNYDEPFTRLQHVGLILAEDGRKMSKRWHNVINPDEVVEKFGADAMRVYEMFMGPFSQPCAWSTNGLIGARRFLDNVYRLKNKKLYDCKGGDCKMKESGLPQMLHKTIKKVTEDIENFHYNTAISQMMIFVNFTAKFDSLPRAAMEKFLIMLAPFAPHLAEELWSALGHKQSIFKETWPEYNPAMVKDETINLVIQINSKVRDTIEAPADINEAEAKKIALASEKIKKWLEGKEVKKIIFVKGKLINIVI